MSDVLLPTREDFDTALATARAAAKADGDAPDQVLVALAAAIPFDHETAVTLADRFVGEEHLFLLESATSGPNARWSFLGFDPLWTYSWRLGEPAEGGHPLAALRAKMRGTRLVSAHAKGVRLGGPDAALFAGPTGFFGYDCVTALEPTSLGGRPPLPKELALPDAYFFLPRSFLALDHLARRLFVVRLATDYDAGITALKALLKRLKGMHTPPPLEIESAASERPDFTACRSAFDEKEFKKLAARCLEEIRAGEIFQIQIGNRLTVDTAARPFDVFRHLRTLNPSPYMFFYRFGEHHVLGASPEMMVTVDGRRVTHRPIAGTRRRSWNAAKDRAMKEELVTSEKERAEHVMLVDLGRNDVGRVAAPGTVKVEELMTVEEYSHVFHMVSQVSGELRPEIDAFDALAAGFPNGTVTGAPKIRAMQLIRELEKMSREFYAGSLGMFDFRGDLRSTILIRSIHMAHGVASTQASAGIVYDSDPADEWQETRNKMAACLLAMQRTR